MSIADKCTQEKLRNILLSIYKKGQESKEISVIKVIEDIKLAFLNINSNGDEVNIEGGKYEKSV